MGAVMKRVILSGGGTGGHIYPAITIARELSKLDDVEFLFVGTPNGMESRIIPKEGYKFASIPAYGLKRSFTLKNLSILMKTAGSLFKARSILKHFHPDVVIGTGGYVCGPILMAAALSHIPTLIQEQNVIPGITNKILSHVVDTIALGYEDAKVRFPRPEKCIYTGNPIRPDIIEAKREESRRELGISPDTFMVLITGGSRGARSINNAMAGVHAYFKNDDHLCLYHVTGTLEYDKIIEKVHADKEGRVGKAGRIIKYEYHMPRALAAADLIICRAGAVSLAELAARGLPAILIPYPYAAEDHQTFNARVFVAAGAAKMIVDKYLTDKELIQDITYLKDTPAALHSMSDASAGLGRIHAGRDIARLALELAEKGSK